MIVKTFRERVSKPFWDPCNRGKQPPKLGFAELEFVFQTEKGVEKWRQMGKVDGWGWISFEKAGHSEEMKTDWPSWGSVKPRTLAWGAVESWVVIAGGVVRSQDLKAEAMNVLKSASKSHGIKPAYSCILPYNKPLATRRKGYCPHGTGPNVSEKVKTLTNFIAFLIFVTSWPKSLPRSSFGHYSRRPPS